MPHASTFRLFLNHLRGLGDYTFTLFLFNWNFEVKNDSQIFLKVKKKNIEKFEGSKYLIGTLQKTWANIFTLSSRLRKLDECFFPEMKRKKYVSVEDFLISYKKPIPDNQKKKKKNVISDLSCGIVISKYYRLHEWYFLNFILFYASLVPIKNKMYIIKNEMHRKLLISRDKNYYDVCTRISCNGKNKYCQYD